MVGSARADDQSRRGGMRDAVCGGVLPYKFDIEVQRLPAPRRPKKEAVSLLNI